MKEIIIQFMSFFKLFANSFVAYRSFVKTQAFYQRKHNWKIYDAKRLRFGIGASNLWKVAEVFTVLMMCFPGDEDLREEWSLTGSRKWGVSPEMMSPGTENGV